MAQKLKAHKQWLRRFFKGDYYIKRWGNLLLVQKNVHLETEAAPCICCTGG